jgi:hypothetical protein
MKHLRLAVTAVTTQFPLTCAKNVSLGEYQNRKRRTRDNHSAAPITAINTIT